jgi:hypothetical protein
MDTTSDQNGIVAALTSAAVTARTATANCETGVPMDLPVDIQGTEASTSSSGQATARTSSVYARRQGSVREQNNGNVS